MRRARLPVLVLARAAPSAIAAPFAIATTTPQSADVAAVLSRSVASPATYPAMRTVAAFGTVPATALAAPAAARAGAPDHPGRRRPGGGGGAQQQAPVKKPNTVVVRFLQTRHLCAWRK